MVKRFLITTAIEETWPKDPEIPVLFLGEWCRLYSQRERWSKMNSMVLPYHWDDSHKLYNDYKYLSDLYEITLQALRKQLNEFHGVDHSLRYWRILVGPWLGYFIQMLFDRWSMLKCAFESHDIIGCKVLVKDSNTNIPNDCSDFFRICQDDSWNAVIYNQLLKEEWQDDLKIENIRKKDNQTQQPNQANGLIRPWLGSFKRKVLSTYNKYRHLFHDSEKYFFFKTYLPFAIEDELLQRLGQNQKFWETPSIPNVEANMGMRKWTIGKYNEIDEFSNIIGRMISLHIPKAYLEGYNSLVNFIEGLTWPKKPKCIFVSNGIQSLDLIKAWVAQKTEDGTRLTIGQHGGHYGIGLFSFIEKHEISICDRYLSWGWSDPDQPKVHPVGQIKRVKPLGVDHQKETGLLLVTNANSRYSFHAAFSGTQSSQWLDYLDDQFQFVESLPKGLQDLLTVRLYFHDYAWEQEKRWNGRFSNIALDLGKKNIDELIAKSRIYVATYNCATYLQSFTMNIPTVIFWNSQHWEIRDAVIPYFDELKQVGIFHETPESAALHVSQVWDDVDGWWKSKPVRDVLEQFKSQYCDIDCDLTGNIEAELRAESNKF